MPFRQFFRQGWDGCIVSTALKDPHKISKIIFVLGANEFLEMLEGKFWVTSFFQGSIW